MANPSKQADNIPVEKEKHVSRFSPGNMLAPFEEMEHWFENMFSRNWFHFPHREWPSASHFASEFHTGVPKVDVIDRDNEINIRAELPGIDKNDIEVMMSDNILTIKGSSKKEEKEEQGDYYRCETSQGSFSRSMVLPADVNTDKASAKFKDGVLDLNLPKTEQSKRRSIKVN